MAEISALWDEKIAIDLPYEAIFKNKTTLKNKLIFLWFPYSLLV